MDKFPEAENNFGIGSNIISYLKRWSHRYKSRPIPTLIFTIIATFFVWRTMTLMDIVHTSLALTFISLILLDIIGIMPGHYRTNILNVGVSLIFLDLVFAQLDLRTMANVLASARWGLLIPAVGFLLVHLIIRIWRWQWLLKPMGMIPYAPAFRAGMIGIGGNMVLPARAGEFLRAYVIGQSSGISKTGAFASVVLERIFDGLTMLLILLGLTIFGVRDPQLQYFGLIGAAFYLLALIGVVIFVRRRDWFNRPITRFFPPETAQKILVFLDTFTTGLESLRDKRQLMMVSFLSLLTWAFMPLSFWPIFLAFDFHAEIPFFAPILLTPLLALTLTIPGAPGGVGVFEWAAALGLVISFQLAGTPFLTEEQHVIAAAFAVLLHISQAVPQALIALVAFFVEGLTMKDLQLGSRI